MKTLKTISILTLLISLIQGCTKKGDVGPTGKDGSSNVSATVFQASSWSWSAPNYYINLNVPEITSDNLTSAAIMVYFTKDNIKWTAIPFTQYNSPYNYLMGFNTSIGQVQITWIYDTSLYQGDNPNINLNDYNEVKKAFNLKD